jgi:hypothetical protein
VVSPTCDTLPFVQSANDFNENENESTSCKINPCQFHENLFSCHKLLHVDRQADMAKPAGIFLQIFVVYASEAECNIYFHILVPLKLY